MLSSLAEIPEEGVSTQKEWKKTNKTQHKNLNG
jgi:hypothetical protein